MNANEKVVNDAVRVGKDLTTLIKKHFQGERRKKSITAQPVVDVTPSFQNGHGVSFTVYFRSPCTCPDDLDCPKDLLMADQERIISCVTGELKESFAPLLKRVGLRRYEVTAQKPKEGKTDLRCTIRASGKHPEL